ncbi:MAG TPA: pitrilysin family protein [Candidatus Sulfotelmatobacter sp.]|nr:pitrilysin family protein [Candidatus Sulfotelmatobacter sp.]
MTARKILFVVLIVLLAMPLAVAQSATFELPEYKHIALPNGLTVLLLEKHNIPMISLEIGLRSGSVADPAGKEGTGSITASLLRKGTATRSSEQLSADIDFIGMDYNTRVDQDGTHISADFLKKDLDAALALVADMVLHPTFPDDEVKKKLAQEQDGIRSAKDDPREVMQQYFMKFLFGDHPYGRPPEGDERSLANISQADIAGFYRKHYTPGNVVIAVAGDFDAAAMQAKLTEIFGAWKGKTPAVPAVPALKTVTGKRVLVVDKPDATQTYFMIGNVGIGDTNADRGYINVVNTLFGGRFTSLFNTELRIKSGYSYGAYSYFEQMRAPGPFIMSSFTKNATTEPALDKSFEVLGRLHKDGFGAVDLASAKTYINGNLPPRYETTPQLARAMIALELAGITREQFNQNLVRQQSTTTADAHRVIDTYFPNQDYVLVMIGKASEIQKIAAKYGTVAMKKIADPGF